MTDVGEEPVQRGLIFLKAGILSRGCIDFTLLGRSERPVERIGGVIAAGAFVLSAAMFIGDDDVFQVHLVLIGADHQLQVDAVAGGDAFVPGAIEGLKRGGYLVEKIPWFDFVVRIGSPCVGGLIDADVCGAVAYFDEQHLHFGLGMLRRDAVKGGAEELNCGGRSIVVVVASINEMGALHAADVGKSRCR